MDEHELLGHQITHSYRLGERETRIAAIVNHVSPLVKYLVLGFSITFWVFGFVFITIGFIVTDETSDLLKEVTVEPGIIAKCLGLTVVIISFFGVVGAFRENLFFLRTYQILLVVTLLFQLFCGFLSFAFFPEVKKTVNKNIVAAVSAYWDNEGLRDFIDTVQQSYECCGSMYADDWDSNSYFSCKFRESFRSCGVPWSCCLYEYQENQACGYGVRHHQDKMSQWIHTIGCLDKAFESFKGTMAIVGGLVVASSFPLVGAIFIIHILKRQIKRQVASVQTELRDCN